MSASTAIESMPDYYARRAAEYERIYRKPERQRELREIEAWLPALFARRRVLEIACGTGWWTPHGARDAASWTAIDINDETLAIARAKPMPACVRFARGDAYALHNSPDSHDFDSAPFDAAFAGFWWSHVPLAALSSWVDSLHAQLGKGSRVVFIDNRYVEGSSTPIARRDEDGNTYQQRVLADGSAHEVLKNFPTQGQVQRALGPRARRAEWTLHTHYWALAYELS